MSASPGHIWVDDRIARRVSTRFDIEHVGQNASRGFLQSTSYLLKGHKREAELLYQGELIGREQELTQLENFAEPLWKGDFAGFLLVSARRASGREAGA